MKSRLFDEVIQYVSLGYILNVTIIVLNGLINLILLVFNE